MPTRPVHSLMFLSERCLSLLTSAWNQDGMFISNPRARHKRGPRKKGRLSPFIPREWQEELVLNC